MNDFNQIHKTSSMKIWAHPFFTTIALALALLFSSPALGQEISDPSSPSDAPASSTNDNQNIRAILLLLSGQAEAIWEELDDLNRLPSTKRIQEKKETLLARLDGIELNFENIAIQMLASDTDPNKQKKKEWIEQVQALTLPLLDALSDATAKPRKIENLKNRIEKLTVQLQQYQTAQNNIDSMLESMAGDPTEDTEETKAFKKRLQKLRQKYDPELVKLNLAEAERILEYETNNTPPLMDSATSAVRQFFKTRGRNLLVTGSLFFGLWWVLMRLRGLLVGKNRLISLPQWMHKVFMTIYSILVILICIVSSIVTLYILNDWLLLSVVILFLVAVAWASRQLIPRMFQEVRLAMNLGTVKEQERLIWSGVPWLVKNIGLQATLINEQLQGGTIQLPVGELIGKQSRPLVDKEPWFPSNLGDWVLLADSTYGKIENQTLEQVILLLKGETRKFYPTPEFLSMTPQNLSNGFRYEIEFGFDYSVQSDICDRIPELFESGLRRHLAKHFEGTDPDFKHLEIAFDHASGSALNLKFLLDVDGRLDHLYVETLNKVQGALVRICNDNELKIPVSQLALNLPHDSGSIQDSIPRQN